MQAALTHYVSGGMPALAARCVVRNRWGPRLAADVAASLLAKLAAAGLHEAAGELLEHLGRPADALDAYTRCGALMLRTWIPLHWCCLMDRVRCKHRGMHETLLLTAA